MDKKVYLTILYDYYGNLLSDKNKEYFENYYFSNLSLAEISENLKVSRNAIHKQLKLIENKLLNYEDKLNLYKKDQEILKLTAKIKDKNLKQSIEELIL